MRGIFASVMMVCGWTVGAHAVTVVSRFDAGLEGWTVEGPGTLEWVATGGNGGGCLRVTRTGPGEVYLVAPAAYQQTGCSGGDTLGCCFNLKTDRAVERGIEIRVISSQGTGVASAACGCQECWFPYSRSVYFPGFAPIDYLGLKIRVGVDPALPVGEVALFDNIEFRTHIANCDGSTGLPFLNANDFQCFLNAFAARDPYANMDGSTGDPAINANDFQTFLGAYAAGYAYGPCP